jgi:ABC-type glycerol-3-phosphate transport system substrate-binding protein
MVEIEFSVMEGNAGDAENLRPLLDAFEKQYRIHVNLTGIPWENGWAEIAKFGIYGHGPDVSSIGTTWIGSLAAMQALRSFTPQEVRALGGTDAFFEPSWRSGFTPHDPDPWAIPWLGDVLDFYYWKDCFAKAGIQNIEAAFASDDALVETLEKLQRSGIPYPLSINVTKMDIILHEAAHWVWAAGGDFVSADGKQVIFTQPAAMEGFKNYFSLQRFISPEFLNTGPASGEAFVTRKSAIMMAGPWQGIVNVLQHPELKDDLGIAAPPKTTYVGGASFVIWRYSRHAAEAFELVRFLSSQPTRIPASPHSNELPTRREAMNMPSLENNIFHHTYLQTLQTGRSFPTMRLWGSIESKLINEIPNIWIDLFSNPDQDLIACLHKYLDPLAQRMNLALGNN